MSRSILILAITGGALAGILTPSRQQPAAAPPPPVADAEKPGRAVLETVLQRMPDGHFYVDAEVNGQIVHFAVDTGASVVVLTSEDARRVGINFSPDDFHIVARGASGDVMGDRININHLKIDQKEAFDMPAMVVAEGLDVSLLGQSFLKQIGHVEIRGDQMILG